MRTPSSLPASPSRRTGTRLALAAVIAAGAVLATLTMGTGTSVAAPAPGPSASATPTSTTAPTDDVEVVEEYAAITGIVTAAESGHALPGVKITATAANGRVIYAVTSENGRYTFGEFPVGGYAITATITGFDEESTSGQLRLGQTKHVDLQMTRSTTDITLDRTEIAAGSTVHVSATGFLAGELVDVEVHSTPVRVASFEADAAGALSERITVPADITPGTHEIVLIGESGRTVAIVVTVTAAEPLVATG